MLKTAIQICEILQKNGFEAVFAGGTVRDKILGIESSDIDIATNAIPDQVESLFEKTIPVGKSFGVIIVVINNLEFEVATFRNDGQYSDSRRPDSISFSTMEEDAKRRDFTINGMFYDPIKNVTYDFVDGQKDLEKKIIRFIGNSEQRITEDKLRMLRAIRFSCKLGFTIEENSWNAIKKHSLEIELISKERIAEEFVKILRTGKYRRAIYYLIDTHLVSIIPEILRLQNCEQPIKWHPEGDVLQHTILALENLPEDASDELKMATLLHDIGKPDKQTITNDIHFYGHELRGADIAKDILTRLKFSNDFIDKVVYLIKNHMRIQQSKKMKSCTFKRMIAESYFSELLLLHRSDCLGSNGDISSYKYIINRMNSIPEDQKMPKNLINGEDLKRLGFTSGPIFKEIIEAVKDEILEGNITTKEQAEVFIINNFHS